MADMTEEMVRAAREFESAAVDAGFDWAEARHATREWDEDRYGLSITAVGADLRLKRWEERDG